MVYYLKVISIFFLEERLHLFILLVEFIVPKVGQIRIM